MQVTNCLYCGSPKLKKITKRADEKAILKCSVCGLMMVDSLENPDSLYSVDYFQKNTDTGSGYKDYLSSPAANLIGKYSFSRIFSKSEGNHIDLGCADGSLMEIFGSHGFESKGLEISRSAAEIAKAKGLDVQVSNLEEFPSDLPKSDLITAFDLIEHLDKPKQVLTGIKKNLKDNGYFVFSTLSVKKNDPTDYWFNHSLEHYVYYNKENLAYILADIFGKSNFCFVEIVVNDIPEFWGVVKKSGLSWEKKIIDGLKDDYFDKSDARTGYMLSLFYNQLSKFDTSTKIAKHFNESWGNSTIILARFYNGFYQGKYSDIHDYAQKIGHLIPIKESVFWQALSFVERELDRIHSEENQAMATEVFEQREQVFRLRDEINSMRNSRVLGKVIKLRDFVGSARQRLKPRVIAHQIRVIGAPFVPAPIRHTIKRAARRILRPPARIDVVKNKSFTEGPLVSVVIPFYNRADTIDDTLLSLKNQTFRGFETIIVDDGSTDSDSVKKFKSLSKHNLNPKLIHQNNQGVAASRNNGIESARGKYIICLDSDDALAPTYIEKATAILESNPAVSLATTYQQIFGVTNELFKNEPYDALKLLRGNMVITAAEFTKAAWRAAGGYKSGIGYEDWEFWVNLSEHGQWGKLIPEPLFYYRTAIQSRFIGDKEVHWTNIKGLQELHPNYQKTVKKLIAKNKGVKKIVEPGTALVNLEQKNQYSRPNNEKQNVLILVPWLTFGGAETLILNFCLEIKNKFNLTFMTGLESEHEWEYKFREISERIYHLANLFEDNRLYLEFISNYIYTREIDTLHIIHNSWVFPLSAELKQRHPKLKIIVTLFNDRAHFEEAMDVSSLIDGFTSDNDAVYRHYRKRLGEAADVRVIPNAVNSNEIYNPLLHHRKKHRQELHLGDKDLAVFFIGRLSEEKNPDVFLKVAEQMVKARDDIHFFVIGDGLMTNEIKKAVDEINSERVRYLGYKAEVSDYLSAADIFVLPSSIEGFPLSILEAMAMKVAVIASDVGAVSEVIEDGRDGFVVKPGSAPDIVKSIEKLANDPKLLTAVKKDARLKVESKYSNIILGRNYEKLYRDFSK